MADTQENEVRNAFAAFCDAMQAGDADTIRALIGEDFSLTHTTGYRQPGEEWLADMDQGQFVYYRIDIRDLRVSATDDTAQLTARTMTDTRVYGGRNDWRLQLDLTYARRGDDWIAQDAVASVWN